MKKSKAGQPKKEDAKIKRTYRLHPDVIAIIDQQSNKTKFIEDAVKAAILDLSA